MMLVLDEFDKVEENTMGQLKKSRYEHVEEVHEMREMHSEKLRKKGKKIWAFCEGLDTLTHNFQFYELTFDIE